MTVTPLRESLELFELSSTVFEALLFFDAYIDI